MFRKISHSVCSSLILRLFVSKLVVLERETILKIIINNESVLDFTIFSHFLALVGSDRLEDRKISFICRTFLYRFSL